MSTLSERVAFATGVSVDGAVSVLESLDLASAIRNKNKYNSALNILDTFIGAIGLKINSKIINEIAVFREKVFNDMFDEFCNELIKFGVVLKSFEYKSCGMYYITVCCDGVNVNAFVSMAYFTLDYEVYRYVFGGKESSDNYCYSKISDSIAMGKSGELSIDVESLEYITDVCEEIGWYIDDLDKKITSLSSKGMLFRDRKSIKALGKDKEMSLWLLNHLKSIFFQGSNSSESQELRYLNAHCKVRYIVKSLGFDIIE